MTETVIFIVALLALDIAILATLYCTVREAPQQVQSQQQPYRRHRPWNFK